MADTQRLRELASKATPDEWRAAGGFVYSDKRQIADVMDDRDDAEYIAAINPSALLELLDQLEAAQRVIEAAKQVADYMTEACLAHGALCTCDDCKLDDALSNYESIAHEPEGKA